MSAVAAQHWLIMHSTARLISSRHLHSTHVVCVLCEQAATVEIADCITLDYKPQFVQMSTDE
eukprot:19872-Heterococcus_DN1.PRE.2